jgi:hypothetical protein
MTSLINNSNANSALINTINSSESKKNPSIYSTKHIYPSAATTYVKQTKSSGSIAVGQTATFDLLKYGIAQQILFCYKKTSNDALLTLNGGDFLDVVDRIELLSSSKVIDTLTRYDIVAQVSDLDTCQFNAVNAAFLEARSTPAKDHLFCCPLVFGFFKDINTNLNLQFNEPMSIRVKFGEKFDRKAAGASCDVTDAYLKIRYKAYNEADFAEILTQNYSEPELNQLSQGYYDENIKSVSLGAQDTNNGANGTDVELKNTDCVNNFYVMVIKDTDPGAASVNTPIAIDEITMTASGQEIIKLEKEELFYSKLSMNGWSCVANETSALVKNVYKIQTGLWEYSGGGVQSNTMSLRELNNPIINVKFSVTAGAGNNFKVIVCEDVLKIYSTTSSTGRMAVALSN